MVRVFIGAFWQVIFQVILVEIKVLKVLDIGRLN